MRKLACRAVRGAVTGGAGRGAGGNVSGCERVAEARRGRNRGRLAAGARTAAPLHGTARRDNDRKAVTASCRHVSGGGCVRRRRAGSRVASSAKVVPWQCGQRSLGVAGSSAVASLCGAVAAVAAVSDGSGEGGGEGGDGGWFCSISSRARASLVFTFPAASRP